MSAGVVLWDFDGTLAWRPGLWSACLLEILDEHVPGHGGTIERIRSDLRSGFPWHRPEEAHLELADPDAWWSSIAPLLGRAFAGAGISDHERMTALARAVRDRFVDGSRVWQVFEDTPAALETTAAAGWRNAILSNHVPELPRLVRALGLAELVSGVFSSASIGYEKPHPEAFRIALRACGDPPRRWMVGDNPVADIAGARALGIPAVRVRDPEVGLGALAASELITGRAAPP